MLNIRQRRFIKEVLAGNTKSAAAVKAGYSDPTYSKALMRNPEVKEYLHKHMERAGITDELLAKKLREGLAAKTPPRKDGGQRYDDQFVRKQFLDMIFRVRGDYAPEKTEHSTKTIQLVLDGNMMKALQDTGFMSIDEGNILEAEVVEESMARALPRGREEEDGTGQTEQEAA